jgi:hypothetical protein
MTNEKKKRRTIAEQASQSHERTKKNQHRSKKEN